MKRLLFLAFAIGYFLNCVAICYAVYDLFTTHMPLDDALKLIGLVCLRIAGVHIWPLGSLLGYF